MSISTYWGISITSWTSCPSSSPRLFASPCDTSDQRPPRRRNPEIKSPPWPSSWAGTRKACATSNDCQATRWRLLPGRRKERPRTRPRLPVMIKRMCRSWKWMTDLCNASQVEDCCLRIWKCNLRHVVWWGWLPVTNPLHLRVLLTVCLYVGSGYIYILLPLFCLCLLSAFYCT